MTTPVPDAPRKQKLVYTPPRLESHPAWRITTAQIGSFPTIIISTPEATQ